MKKLVMCLFGLGLITSAAFAGVGYPDAALLKTCGTAVLVSMMTLMFLGGLLKKGARVVDGLGDPLKPPPPRPPL